MSNKPELAEEVNRLTSRVTELESERNVLQARNRELSKTVGTLLVENLIYFAEAEPELWKIFLETHQELVQRLRRDLLAATKKRKTCQTQSKTG